MKQFPQKIIAGLIFASALLGVQAQAEIQTSIIANDYRTSSEEIKNFSGATPCYLIIDKKHPDNYAKIIEIFKQAGFNITNDDSVECAIYVSGEVVSGGKSIYFNDVLAKQGNLPEVQPNPQVAAQINAAINQAVRAGEPVNGDGINALTQIGGIMNGSTGASIGGGAGVLINILSGFSSGPSTPEGMADIWGLVRFGGFFKHTQILPKVYAASSTPEKPEVLVYAGVQALAEAIKTAIRTYHTANNLPFDMPTASEKTKLASMDKSAPAPSTK